jgi:hypothetical protein
MGRFKSNVLAPRRGHRPPRDSYDLDGRLSGSLASFKFAIDVRFEKVRSDSFQKDFAPRPILLFQKMRGWLRRAVRFLYRVAQASHGRAVKRQWH